MALAVSILSILALLVAIVLGVAATYGSLELVKSLRSFRKLTEDVDARLPVLLDDADVTVQAASLELMRLDEILTSVQEVSDTAAETTRAAQEAVHAPMAKLAEYAEKARKFLAAMRERNE